jgi:hypothetical protein
MEGRTTCSNVDLIARAAKLDAGVLREHFVRVLFILVAGKDRFFGFLMCLINCECMCCKVNMYAFNAC